ncbi:MAG: DUF4136 domain-containing protein [Bacteroidota bacterium]
MKKASIVLLSVLLAGCFGYKELPVEYDYSYKGRFDKYNSYDFITSYALKDSDTSLIRSSIEQHMKFLGYKRKKRKPDLLLNYAIYVDSLNLRGYDQPDINQWIKSKDRNLEYNQLKFGLSQGTLLIQVFDRKQNSSIWQGYATDEYQKLNFESYQEVRNAVKSILNKYQFFADGFIEEQMKKAEENN